MEEAQLPVLRIKYGWHLDGFFKSFVEFNPKFENKVYPIPEEIEDKVKEFRESWEPYGPRILSGAVKILDLSFFQGTIDVYIVGRCQTFSDPMVISSHFSPDEFVDILTHELLHRLLTDNTRHLDVRTIWEMMFPGRERLVRNHVLVHAAHEYIYREVLGEPHRLERDIAQSAKFPAYQESWEIVRQRGYKSVIEEFRKRFLNS